MPRIIWISLFLFFSNTGFAQDSLDNKVVNFSGFIEGYYAYDFGKPQDHKRPAYVYSHNRHNEFTVNLAFLKAQINQNRIRANLAIGVGTYMNANYISEPGTLKNVLEANAGYKLMATKNLWFDVGILPSHIGVESAISKDCWTLTRSLVAENSPYFESGAKLTYGSKNEKWLFSILALNGWQRITRLSGNSLMSWGTQVQFKPSDGTLLNYSNFLGTDKPDSVRQLRFYQNVYSIFYITKKIGITLGSDYGMEQDAIAKNKWHKWFAPLIIIKYIPSEHWHFALRGEYFEDRKGVLISTTYSKGFTAGGLSFNIAYMPEKNIAIRIEGKLLRSTDSVFRRLDIPSRSNSVITFSIAINF